MFGSPILSGFAGGLVVAGLIWLLVKLWPRLKRWLAARKRGARPPSSPNKSDWRLTLSQWRSILRELYDRSITWICLVLAAILIATM